MNFLASTTNATSTPPITTSSTTTTTTTPIPSTKTAFSSAPTNSTASIPKTSMKPSTKPSGFSYHTYETMTNYLQHHVDKFPAIFKLHDLGTSKDRKIWCAEITTEVGKSDPDKTNIGLVAGFHGYDTIGREVLLMFLHSLTKGYTEKQPRVMKLLENTRIHIVPMVMAKEMELAKEGDCSGEQFPKSADDIYNQFSLNNNKVTCLSCQLDYKLKYLFFTDTPIKVHEHWIVHSLF